MGSLFTGSPQVAPSYATSTTETPKWMQDAIYNQIQLSQNIANTPYQPYTLPTVAKLSPLQQQAYTNVQANQGSWSPNMAIAQTGMEDLTTGTASTDAAKDYMTEAKKTSVADISTYMNPYIQNVNDLLAKQGARNLSENLLPAVSDQFIRAGQFGGSRMGEFGSRALRDTQESVLDAQSKALQTGYGQAVGAARDDLTRQGQLATTAGNLATTDASRQMSALNQVAGMAQQRQGMQTADAAALEAVGASERRQTQEELDAAYKQYQSTELYPKQQADWLSTQVRGMAPITPQTTTTSGTTTTFAPSPLSQLATGLYTYKGLNSVDKP